MSKVLAVTGHREFVNKLWVATRMTDAIARAMAKGYGVFLSGGAPGVDMMFASGVINVRKTANPLAQLKLYLPFRGFNKTEIDALDLAERDEIIFIDERNTLEGRRKHSDRGVAAVGKYFERNDALVRDCDAIIAVLDGRPHGGTAYTFAHARKEGKPIFWINPIVTEAQWLNT